jgi:hypothetical protein
MARKVHRHGRFADPAASRRFPVSDVRSTIEAVQEAMDRRDNGGQTGH